MKTALALSPTKANFAPLFYTGDLALGIRKAAEFGFDGVELNLRDSEEIDQEWLLKEFNERKIAVPSIGTGQSYFTDHLSLADPNPQVQEKIRQRMVDHVRFASRVQAMVVIGSVRGKLDTTSEQSRRRNQEIAVRATQEIARYAAGMGVRLLVEPINRYETNFINTIAEALEFIEMVGETNIGVVADTFHMNIEEPSISGGLKLAGSLLWHVHLVDSNRYAPGMGHLDFSSIVGILKEMGFDQYVSAEIVPNPDCDTAAQRWMSAVRTLIHS